MCTIREKISLAVPLTLGILIFYFGTLHSSFFNATPIPDTVIDRAIPFIPAFVVPYFSYYLLLLTPLFVIHESQELRNTAFGYALIVFTSCVAFFFWPTAISTSYTDPLIRGLLSIDRPRNACPSLHASLSLFCALCTQRNLKSSITRYGLWIWTLLVIAATLFTKRHAVVDVAAGVVFGGIVYRLIFDPIHQDAGDPKISVEDPQRRDRPFVDSSQNIESLRQCDSRKYLLEFAIFVTLAATGASINIWAIAHSSFMALAIGVLTTTGSLYSLLHLLHEGLQRQLVPNCLWNRISMVLSGFIFLISFSAFRVQHLRRLRSSGGHRDNFVRRIWELLLIPILIPVSALRFGSATQRKIVCSEYALLFLVCSVLLRTFSMQALVVVWILPVVFAGSFWILIRTTQ